ncbi:hypothetical protein [Granulicella arctica]|uniref:hypothetical protein n=1 Tax=Granulicella arctica TaxID=940613 RepID=UPI0021E0E38A|nr:hypothetical protein [Granulicella arctica]
MKVALSLALTLLASSFALAQTNPDVSLAPGTTLPISFTHGIDAGHARAGAVVEAKTMQQVRLSNDHVLPSGTRVIGHVVTANAFSFDKTPYAKQSASTLAIQFDSLVSSGETIPLHVYVRAMADPLSVWDAQRPKATDLDPLSTTTQIGGDQVTPSQSEVESQQGETVGYKRSSGVYAHLVSAVGRGSDGCDATDTEQSMGLFSASACGLYGYTDASLLSTGKSGDSTLTLASRRRSAQVWAKSEALLEVIGQSRTISQ